MPRKPLASHVAARLQQTKPHLFLSKKQKEFLSSSRNLKPQIQRLHPGVFEVKGRTGTYQIIDGSCNCPGAYFHGKCWHLPAVKVWAKQHPCPLPVPPKNTGKPMSTEEYVQSGMHAKDVEAHAERNHLAGAAPLSPNPLTVEESMQGLAKVTRKHLARQRRLLSSFLHSIGK